MIRQQQWRKRKYGTVMNTIYKLCIFLIRSINKEIIYQSLLSICFMANIDNR